MGTKYRIEMTKYPYQGNIDKSYNTNSFIKFIFNLVILFVLMVFKKYDIVNIAIRTISKKDQRKETERHDNMMCWGRTFYEEIENIKKNEAIVECFDKINALNEEVNSLKEKNNE